MQQTRSPPILPPFSVFMEGTFPANSKYAFHFAFVSSTLCTKDMANPREGFSEVFLVKKPDMSFAIFQPCLQFSICTVGATNSMTLHVLEQGCSCPTWRVV